MKYSIPLSVSGLEMSMRRIEEYHKKILNGCNKLLKELARQGADIAEARFDGAIYSGINDVHVKFEVVDEKHAKVIANGTAVLFIEFGTGIVYPRTNPEDQFTAGSYGKGMGKRRTWGYYGAPGNNGWYDAKRGISKTHGDPSNNCMYDTKKELEDRITEIARGCFDV